MMTERAGKVFQVPEEGSDRLGSVLEGPVRGENGLFGGVFGFQLQKMAQKWGFQGRQAFTSRGGFPYD
jgi:hypothetical protein